MSEFGIHEKLTLYSLFKNRADSSSTIVYYDGNKRHSITFCELESKVNYLSQLFKDFVLSNSIICCLIKPGLSLPALILG